VNNEDLAEMKDDVDVGRVPVARETLVTNKSPNRPREINQKK
jgi:hypothetical protein